MKKTLTAVAIERLRPPVKGRHVAGDITVPGLYLRVTEGGVKSWSVFYRVVGEGGVNIRGHLLKGKQRRITLGSWPAVDLPSARERARKILSIASEGKDPAELRREEAMLNVTDNVKSVIQRFIALHAKPNTRNWRGTERIFEMWVIPKWEKVPIRSIRRSDVHELLDELVKQKRISMANEVRKHLSRLFNWAADREIISANPLAGMARRDLRPTREAGRALGEQELRVIWQAADQMKYPFGAMFKVLILTGQRLREIAHASRPEINELQKLLEIPRGRYKGKRDHVIPLVTEVVQIFEDLPRWNKGDFIFTTTAGEHPVSGFSKAKSRLDKLAQTILQENTPAGEEVKQIARYRVHDFRVTCESGMAALGIEHCKHSAKAALINGYADSPNAKNSYANTNYGAA